METSAVGQLRSIAPLSYSEKPLPNPTPAPITVTSDLVFPGGPDLNSATNYVMENTTTPIKSITVAGYVSLYVTGNLDLSGTSIVGNANTPSKLRVFMVGGGTVNLGGKSSQYMELWAPNSKVTLNGTPGFYGSIIAGSLDIKGTVAIHYDGFFGQDTTPYTVRLVQ